MPKAVLQIWTAGQGKAMVMPRPFDNAVVKNWIDQAPWLAQPQSPHAAKTDTNTRLLALRATMAVIAMHRSPQETSGFPVFRQRHFGRKIPSIDSS